MGFLSLGFGLALLLGLIVFGVSAFFQAYLFLLLGSRCPNTPFFPQGLLSLGFRSGFTPFRVSGWVYSFFVMGFLSLGFRSGMALFRASAWV